MMSDLPDADYSIAGGFGMLNTSWRAAVAGLGRHC